MQLLLSLMRCGITLAQKTALDMESLLQRNWRTHRFGNAVAVIKRHSNFMGIKFENGMLELFARMNTVFTQKQFPKNTCYKANPKLYLLNAITDASDTGLHGLGENLLQYRKRLRWSTSRWRFLPGFM